MKNSLLIETLAYNIVLALKEFHLKKSIVTDIFPDAIFSKYLISPILISYKSLSIQLSPFWLLVFETVELILCWLGCIISTASISQKSYEYKRRIRKWRKAFLGQQWKRTVIFRAFVANTTNWRIRLVKEAPPDPDEIYLHLLSNEDGIERERKGVFSDVECKCFNPL